MNTPLSDVMSYYDDMEIIQSDIMDKVLTITADCDMNRFTKADVLTALKKDSIDLDDYAALLSPAAAPYLEAMAMRAKNETRRHFGNTICLFTPLYIANYCENHCVYCGFNCKNKINRAKLTFEEIEKELAAIAKTGLREILLLTGESRHMSDVAYIGEAVKLAHKYFEAVGIEIYPVNSDEYAFLHQCGADFVSIYQETYQPEKYEKVHLSGHKRSFAYRFNGQERALMGGMRGVAFGALLGLDDFRKDAYATGLHAYFIQKKYPHAEISFSVPRLRPYVSEDELMPQMPEFTGIKESQLLQVMLAYRILFPYAGITISSRERGGFKDHVLGLAATKTSAGVSTAIGGHEDEAKGDGQFEISDGRSVDDIHQSLLNLGLQPAYTDYLWV